MTVKLPSMPRPSLLKTCAALMAAGLALNAHAQRCIDEENIEMRQGVSTNGAPITPTNARENLRFMVQTALERSRAVGAARLLAEAAEIDTDEIRASRWPQLGASGFLGTTTTRAPNVEDVSGKQGRVGLTVSAPLFDAGRTTDLVNWRKSQADAARLGQISTQEQVALQTVSLAIERARYCLQVQVYQQYSRKMGCLVEALETIVRADRGRASELVQAQKNQQQAETAQTQTLALVRQTELKLRRFVGDGLPPSDGLSSVLLTTPNLQDVLAEAERAPDIEQLQAQARAADAYASSVKASRWPQISAVASTNEVRGVSHSSNWSAGVTVNVPIFNLPQGYTVDSSAKRAVAARYQRDDALEARRVRMAEVHDQALSSFDRARRTAETVRDSDRLRGFTLQQWQQLGRRSLFDVMSAEGEHYNLRVSYVNALYDAQQSNVLLWSLGTGVVDRLK